MPAVLSEAAPRHAQVPNGGSCVDYATEHEAGSYDPHPLVRARLPVIAWSATQKPLIAFAGDPASIIHAEGPTQSGKSYALAHAFTAYILVHRWPTAGFDGFLVLGPSMVQVHGILRNIQEAAESMGARCRVQANGTAMLAGMRILGKPIASRGTNKGFHGGRFGAVLCDEVTLCDQEAYEYACGRVVRAPEGDDHGKMFTGTNPMHPQHWFHQRTDKLSERVVYSSIDDNPALTTRTKADLHSQWAGVMRERMYYGRRAAHAGQVYPFFTEQAAGAPPTEGDPVGHLSIDCGHRNSTHAIYWLRWPNHLHAADEWVWNGREHGPRSTADQVAHVGAWLGDRRVRRAVYDPAALDFGIELSKALPNCRVVPADNTVMDGIQQVMLLMERGRVTVDAEACPITMRDCGDYSWDEKVVQRGLPEAPLKVNDHAPDAVRYMVMDAASRSRIRTRGMV